MSEQEIEKIQGRAYRVGQISGIEEMALFFKKESGSQFSIGQKKAAEITFEFAEWLDSKAIEYRKKFDAEYPKK